MKRFFPLIFSLMIVFAMSCEGLEFSVDCSECTAEEPYEATLKCQIDLVYDETLVQVWEGKLEDSILVDSRLILLSSVFEKNVALNKQYTITATYIIDNKTYVAVDSASPKVKRSKSKCDELCYYVYGNEVNLRLKYR